MRANAPLLAGAASLVLLLVALAPSAAGVDVTATIGNVAPVVVSITLSGLTGGALSPTAGTTSSLTATVVASDVNGAADVDEIAVGITKPDGSTVHVAESAASFSSNSGLLATYTKTLTMNYYDAAALGASKYKVTATATDVGGLFDLSELTMAEFNYNQLVALSAPSTFALSASAGGSSAATALAVNNYGNVQIDTQVSGTALTYNSVSIAVGDIDYSLDSGMASPTDLTGSAATISTYNLAPANGAAKSIYFQLTPTTPADGLPAGPYTGTLTVTAVSG